MAAPKNNTYGIGNHRAGRPPKFATVEELHQRISEYFDTADSQHQPTLTGLALFLGFHTRQSLYDYAKREAFSYTIKRALLVIESVYEDMLTTSNSSGAIFMLKSMGWRGKVVRVTNKDIIQKLPPFLAKPKPSSSGIDHTTTR